MDEDAVAELRAQLPAGVALEEDITPAAWFLDEGHPSEDAWRIGAYMPAGFDAHVRIFHPARDPHDGNDRRWQELAAVAGRTLGPEITWKDVKPEDERDISALVPGGGSLPPARCDTLAALLRGGSYRSYFCLWEGFGLWRGGGLLHLEERGIVLIRAAVGIRRRSSAFRTRRDEERRRRQLAEIPRVDLANRSYYLFSGAIDAVPRLTRALGQSPNLWWPEDRSWFVSTEIEGFSTYVGGDERHIAALMDSRDLETVPVTREHRLDPEVW
ncbi:MAG: hypothetical protein WD556_10405 [Actinomycetota bacterium]